VIARKNEVDAVLAVLLATDDEGFPLYDDEASMAKQIVKALAAELAKREHYAIVPRGAGYGYGPYHTAKEAEKAWTKEIGASFTDRAALLRVFPWSPPVVEEAGPKTCDCGHQPEQHVVKNQRGGKMSSPKECGVRACPCSQYARSAA
jgi:hypothetical protein